MRGTVPPHAGRPRPAARRARRPGVPPYRRAAPHDGGIPVLHNYRTMTAADVERDVAEGLAALAAGADAPAAAPPATRLEVVQVLDGVQAGAHDLVGRAAFAGWVHPDTEVRE